MFKRKILILSTVFLFSTFCFAENEKVRELVAEPQTYYTLLAQGSTSVAQYDGSTDYSLLPESVYADTLRATKVEKLKKNIPFFYETLYLIPKQEILEISNSSATDITIDDVSRVVRSLSKMEGLKYYSSTKKKECVLYKKVYMIENETGKTPIPDQNTGNADGQVSYCLQDDNSFGVNRYILRYHQCEDQILASFSILDSMGVGPFKAIHRGKMVINILVIDCGEDILLYLCTDVDSVKFPGIRGQIKESMTTRMEAVYEWFKTQF